MSERARRSLRDGSSRYSIDTLFPGLSNNSSHTRSASPDPSMMLGGIGGIDVVNSLEDQQPRSNNRRKAKTAVPIRNTQIKTDKDKEISELTISDMIDDNSWAHERRVKEETLSSNDEVTPVGQISLTGPTSRQVLVKEGSSGNKRKAGTPLKQATQPKQMYQPIATMKMSKKGMFEAFQPWVLQTYGDSAKTKTITKKKYSRIVKTLRGEEINNAENSKFRFWVKAKGFHIGPPSGHPHLKDERSGSHLNPSINEPDLYVPTTVKDGSGTEKPVYKRVAVVEYFFDIIYTVHVETEAKNGKHAGQKRTYRAITEKYAFLPREAVTKFLLQCTECQKRGSPSVESTPGNGKGPKSTLVSPENIFGLTRTSSSLGKTESALDINFDIPFTVEKHPQKQMKGGRNGFEKDQDDDEDINFSDPNSGEDDHEIRSKGPLGRSKNGEGKDMKQELSGSVDWLGYQPLVLKKEMPTTNNNIYSNGKQEFREQSSPMSLSDRLAVNHETVHDETSSNGNKDDEDDDDDEEDKMDTRQHDPERLKAFNMFVRLFVDENLDRMVPISKQPKEKIQAIIDSCTRQFPEFADRSRKRIRTYLKSCRRNKRSRDGGWESSRPTPAHLTSVQAEQILAQACENESQNAKRMRMGLEPVSQPLPIVNEGRNSKENGYHGSNRDSGDSSPEKQSKVSSSSSTVSANIAATIAAVASNSGCLSPTTSIASNGSNDQNLNLSLNGVSSSGESILSQLPSAVLGTKSIDRNPLVDFRALNGTSAMSMYRPSFGQTFPRPAPFPSLFPSVTTSAAAAAAAIVGSGNPTFPHNTSPIPVSNGDAGPTDLSMKSRPMINASQKLNATELATVRQLITGYRESAAFLLRSADELEQLLIQQQ